MQSRSVGPGIIYVAVVDDDESTCRSFGRLPRAAGFQPIPSPSAEAFLGETKGPRFDWLVLDIQSEGISGLKLSQALAAVNDTTPVVFVTAHEGPEVPAGAECARKKAGA
jgi:FixJ family two-component response regulator